MKLYPECISCLVAQQERFTTDYEEDWRVAYMREALVHIGSQGPEHHAAWISAELADLRERYFGKQEKMNAEKVKFNRLVMEMEETLSKEIQAAEDPLKAAMEYSIMANYIDFSCLTEVSSEAFMEFFQKEGEMLDEVEYQNFLTDMDNAKTFIYMMDNCGEVVIDKLVIREMKKRFPYLKIYALVKGKDAINDATREDADMCGITEEVEVLDTNCGVQGVMIDFLTEETREIFMNADVMLAKGQGNFETLSGCGLNIYYLLLCKCPLFTRHFEQEPFTGMFINENRSKTME